MRAFRLGLAGCGLLLLPGTLWAQTATFEVSATTGVDGRPVAVAMADVNGDKHLDVITANSDDASISVLTGDGSGMLTFAGTFDAGSVPMGLAVDDFDGDKKPDVLVSNANSGTVSFLKGDGAAGFTLTGEPIVLPGACSGNTTTACDPDVRNPQGMDQCEVAGLGTCSSLPTGPGAMAVGDLNGDGLPDVAIASEGSGEGDGELSILISHGDGTFEGLAPMVAGSKTGEVVIADFNGDHHNDVAVANNHGIDLVVFLGDGHGHFDPGISSTIGVSPTGLSAGDVNEDGREDLVVSTAAGITVMLGDGQGHFAVGESFTAGNTPSAVVVADLDGDGHKDVAVSNSRSIDATVLLGDGTGSFGPARTFVADGEPLSVAVGDLDEDGLPDIVTGDFLDQQQGSVAVFLNQGMGRLLGVEDLNVGVVTAVASGDIDNDALPDIVVAFGSSTSSSLRVYLARGSAGFVAMDDVPVGQGASAIVLADFNRDGKLDAATVNKESSNLSILLGRGDGTFEVASLATPANPVTCTVGDFNHDRIPDLAVVSKGDPGSIKIFLGMGNGTFQAGNTYATQNGPDSVAVGLFNNDAFEDLVITNGTSGTLTVLLGTGNGGFTAGETVIAGLGPVGVAVLDANRDGIDDLAVAQSISQNVLVYFGKGDGTFTFNNMNSAGATPSGLVVRDLNGDGLPDMAVANQVSNDVSILRGNSVVKGSFTKDRSVRVSRMPTAIVGADFDGDGRYDVVTGNAANAAMNVSVIKNSTAGVNLLRGDGNGDGRIGAADVVAARRAAGAVNRGRPEDIFRVGFGLGPGVDANGDGIVTPQDTRATVTRIFLPATGA